MNAIDIIALSLIALALVFALYSIKKRGGKCGGCAGDCANCPHKKT